MTTEELDRLQALADAATPEPWRACAWDPMERPHVHKDVPSQQSCRPPDVPLTAADAAFIAASREALPRLVAEVRALRERLLEIDRLVVDAFDATDPIIYERDWGSDNPKDSLRTLHAILTKIRGWTEAASERPAAQTIATLRERAERAEREVRALRDRVAALEAERDGLVAQRAMTVARVGGTVEGLPTHTGNFLQRIDALRTEVERLTRERDFIKTETAERVLRLEGALVKSVAERDAALARVAALERVAEAARRTHSGVADASTCGICQALAALDAAKEGK